MLPTIPHPQDFDVSLYNGFLPDELPIEQLSDPYYAKWENIIRNLQALILTRRLRSIIRSLPVLSTDHLKSEAEWRRAYSILAFMAHSYIWAGDRPEEIVPPSISAPFLQTCDHLELPPVATYAAVVLWNFKPLFDDEPLSSLENLFTLTTFTGSTDESWFYLVSVAIEAAGAPIIPTMLRAIAAARANDRLTVIACLQSFAERLDQLSSILIKMYEACDPHVFYHRIRPFLAGSKNMADAGLPRGVLFDDGSGRQEYVQHAGGSNAQSSLIQFFDIALGIEHRPTGPKTDASTSSSSSSHSAPDALKTGAPSNSFIHEMRKYMPGPHRRFLESVSQVANIRPFVESRQHDKALTIAYDACLAMLRDFRDRHIQMVSRYIVVKSRESRFGGRHGSSSGGSLNGGRESDASSLDRGRSIPSSKRVNLASPQYASEDGKDSTATSTFGEESKASREKKSLRGTGGTALIPFLKQARDETGEPSILNWAKRVMSNGPGYAEGFREKAATIGTVDEHPNGRVEVVGLAGIWSVDDSEGGICHW